MDSMASYMYIDRNNRLFTESELTAFKVLHQEAKATNFRKVVLCGMCYERFEHKPVRVKTKNTVTPITSRPNPTSPVKSSHYYQCPFCHTANEPLRNTCKGCSRILFSTEYDTKRVSASSFNYKKILLIAGIAVLAIYLVMSGKDVTREAAITTPMESVFNNEPGTYEWADGSSYTGDFKKGKPHGKGTLHWYNGNTYTGEFVDGQITGSGKLNWADGTVYEGEVFDGRPHGQGTMYYVSGSVYTGQWVNGEPE
ncbi:MORN repeat-containing protein [Litchfieldia alkalitelluris]|uniref:MORN repeat-containing protein n=1 Tax=Litchfieldia alkalitelluris TaxID=304268 RepID=UPI00195712EE|nr:hypothetical protein [Litchfieldia alkalitelluris]